MHAKGVAGVIAIAALAATTRAQPRVGPNQEQRQVPVFRSTIELVPIDVRVTDKNGRPVSDLQAVDFTITEDGIRQDIRHFSARDSTPEKLETDTPLVLRKSALNLQPQTNRIFLIVLGRGRLQEPSKAMDALTSFVGGRLLPQDQVAVFAYDRATAFTRNHRRIVAVLERFKEVHEQVDFSINQQMGGLAAIYGSKAIPRSLRRQIDWMFAEPGLPASQALETGVPADSRQEADTREALNGTATMQTRMFADLSLEQFVEATAQTLQDLGNLYAGIEYLRRFEGEKHLIFLTERGLTLSRLEEDERLAAAANDARVAIDTVETGGLYVGQAGGRMAEGRWNQMFAFKTLRTIAELTGGVSSIADYGSVAMERISNVTTAGYLLGYYPTNDNWDGRYRKVTVKVSPPDVNVYYRHGYYGREELEPFDRSEMVATHRIRAAASFRREIKDIRLKVDASLARAADEQGYDMSISVNIDPSKLSLTLTEGVHIGRIRIAVFCWDEQGNDAGISTQTANLKLADEDLKKILIEGIRYGVRFPVQPSVQRIRVVVYDFKADLIGSADKLMR